MKQKYLRIVLIILLCFLFGISQIYSQRREKCPDYIWAFDYLPISYLRFEEAPSKITYTGGGDNEIDGKFRVRIGLKNLSEKTIDSVKFQWYLFPTVAFRKDISVEERDEALEKIIVAKDEISVAEIKDFHAEIELEVETRLTCDKISSAIEKYGSSKDLAVEFVVTEISYSDNSNWKRK